MLHIEHPVMLAAWAASLQRARGPRSPTPGLRLSRASTMSSERLSHEIAATKELTTKPFGVDLLTAFPRPSNTTSNC